MTTREFYVARIKAEAPAFVKVVKALPAKGAGYKPDPKSRSGAELAWMLAGAMQGGVLMAKNFTLEWVDAKADKPVAQAADALDKAAKELAEVVAKLDDKAWEKEAAMTMGGKAVWKAPLGEMLWGFLFDGIHHRGQLSTYLRAAGGKVPSIYGPSADDPGA